MTSSLPPEPDPAVDSPPADAVPMPPEDVVELWAGMWAEALRAAFGPPPPPAVVAELDPDQER